MGLVRVGSSQQESASVFLSMGHNGFSPPMKPYSSWDRCKLDEKTAKERRDMKEYKQMVKNRGIGEACQLYVKKTNGNNSWFPTSL